MEKLTREEVEIILGWWEEEKEKTRATFLESLTPGQREMLRRYYRAKRKVATLKKWVKQEKIRRRKVAVPEWAWYDYGLLKLAKVIGWPIYSYCDVNAALVSLSDVEQAILKATFGFEGRRVSLRELSERLALPGGVILALRRRALRKLAKMLGVSREKGGVSLMEPLEREKGR
jgi:DNA-directed RNA polymerase sigma subunit (sigma70/sigma32)